MGFAGWYVKKMLGRTTVFGWQARLFSFLLPLARIVERAKFFPGLSVVAIASKR